ncbi:hypothetical protein YTPLAS18_15760 [Nitrospira sp.]|nr:hypothetical protein YTPLAS18_15760 [Nitrospira sp.]
MRRILTTVLFISFVGVVGLAGCDREGPAEKAGEKIDKGVEKTTDAVKDATN